MRCSMGPSTAGVLDSILLREVPTGPSGHEVSMDAAKEIIELQVEDIQ